jgi:sulfur transfer complex TusBCD TusB component (DsrH family)
LPWGIQQLKNNYSQRTSNSVVAVKTTDINLEKKIIYFKERPPVYLSEDGMILVNEYAKLRINIRNIENKTYLLISSHSAEVYKDQPVINPFIAQKFKQLSGFTSKSLRITCFNTIAGHFGPQLLVEGFGVSLTQASRYGKLEDYLIEEQIQSQREYLNK